MENISLTQVEAWRALDEAARKKFGPNAIATDVIGEDGPIKLVEVNAHIPKKGSEEPAKP